MHSKYPNPDMEKQADKFAAAFLMPADDIRQYLNDVTLAKLGTLKPYWKVSMQALLSRAKDLGQITPRKTRTLWMQLSKLGYRTREPVELDLPPELPSLFPKIIEVLRTENSISDLAKLCVLNEHEVKHMYLGGPQHLKVVG